MKSTKPTLRAMLLRFAVTFFIANCVFAQTEVKTPNSSQSQPAPPPDKSIPDVADEALKSVVLIKTYTQDGRLDAKGSGFIISEDGQIATNAHVIDGDASATVKFSDGTFYEVEGVLAQDKSKDLAVLKIRASGKRFAVIPLGDSDRVLLGEQVVAVGNPEGFEATVSNGIISAKRDASKLTSRFLSNFMVFQTTAPISHGSSGGVLLNLRGEAIGITSAFWGEGQNLNFAIPINYLKLLSLEAAPVPLSGSRSPAVESSMTPVNADEIWTSMTSGLDYKLRFEGAYIYAELLNLPARLAGTLAFVRSELRREGTIWKGTLTAYLPCEYRNTWTKQMETKWFSQKLSIEISTVNPTRIEGRVQDYSGGYDCKKGQPKGSLDWKSFTWIPKEPGPSTAVRETVTTDSPKTAGTIFLTSNPTGAEIYVDDSFVAKSPTTLNLKPGQHYVRMFMNGYKNWSQQVTVVGGSEATVTAVLQKSN
jgi:Trypsin-like peptidase domain/PEGA domain